IKELFGGIQNVGEIDRFKQAAPEVRKRAIWASPPERALREQWPKRLGNDAPVLHAALESGLKLRRSHQLTPALTELQFEGFQRPDKRLRQAAARLGVSLPDADARTTASLKTWTPLASLAFLLGELWKHPEHPNQPKIVQDVLDALPRATTPGERLDAVRL